MAVRVRPLKLPTWRSFLSRPTTSAIDRVGARWTPSLWPQVRGFGAVGQGVQVHRRPVRSVNFAPDGQRLCTASEDGTAKVFDLSTGKLLKEVDHHNTIWWADFSQDGQMLVTCSDDRSVRVYDCSRWELLDAGTRVRTTGVYAGVVCAVFEGLERNWGETKPLKTTLGFGFCA
ncbi:unnamed protein product, partial [Durusdinium trenchii]